MSTKVTLQSNPSTLVSINQNKPASVKTIGLLGSGGVNRLVDLVDVDASNASQNDTLIFNANTGLFSVQTIPVINGGTF